MKDCCFTPIFVCIVTTFMFFAQSSNAGPWVDTGDYRTRHHLQFLNDTGAISLPLTTWPMAWAEISRELGDVSLHDLSEAQLWSYRYLRHIMNNERTRVTSSKQTYASNSLRPFTSFSSLSGDKLSIKSETTVLLDDLALNISAQAAHKPTDGEKYRLDGSYIAGSIGNWAVGIGAVDRWWGPSWNSSLILSNNARPSPGIFIQRKESNASSIPILSAAGPWAITLFANQLESTREVSRASLIGARFTLSPLRNLELGASRLGLWGGEGKLENPESFLDFLLFDEIIVSDTPARKEASNQLIAYDIRINHSIAGLALAIYGQHVSNENQPNAAEESGVLIGLENAFHIRDAHSRFALEYSDTRSSAGSFETPSLNRLYDHPYYPGGYRYELRNIGESAGTNALKYSLSGNHYFGNGQELGWHLMRVKLNPDSTSSNFYDDESLDQLLAETYYRSPLNKRVMATLGIFFLEEQMKLQSQDIETGAYLHFEFRY